MSIAQLYDYILSLGGSSGWWVASTTSTTPATATANSLILFDLATCAADAIVNAPSSPSLGTYFGVEIDGRANGYKLEVKSGATVLATLNVDTAAVWLVYTGSTWRVLSSYAPPPIFEARFSPLGCWLADGADTDLTDTSGNSRTLTKGVTIPPGTGYGQGRLATGYPGRYARTDATFQLAGAMSYEFLATPFLSAAAGWAFQCGTGTGGSATNALWGLRIDLDAGVPRWRHRQQSGANVNADLYGPNAGYGPAHVCVTRAAPSGGTTATKIYVNGALGGSGNLTTPTNGGSSQLHWGGIATAQAQINSQWGSVWDAELTAAQVAYLAKLRLGEAGPLGG